MTSAIDRLSALLDERDERIEQLEAELSEARGRVASAKAGWSLPREVPDAYPELPLPRLEMAWTPDAGRGWRRYTVEYRLVYRHLCDQLIVVPLGSTEVSSGLDQSPFERALGDIGNALPFRDGAHIHHDAAHLRLPAYALTPDGPKIIGPGNGHCSGIGEKHRRGGQ